MELFKFNINNKYKLLILLISFIITFIIFSFLPKRNLVTKEIVNNEYALGIEKLLNNNERLISLKITNSSRFILDSINSVVNIDIVSINTDGISNILTRNAKLIEIDKKYDESSISNFYILSIIVSKEEARKILRFQDVNSLSIMISTENDNQKNNHISDIMNDLEIIEEDPYDI